MIPARKWPRFARWFAGTVTKRLHGQFGEVRVAGLDAFARAAAAEPLVVVANHTAWWDSLLAIALVTGRLGLDGYALMEAEGIRRHPYLGRVGGFGVERGVEGDGDTARRYAASLLDRPGRVIWIYPQGEERPAEERPLQFKWGAARIGAEAGCRFVPVGVRYVFGPVERPAVVLSFGAPRMLPPHTAPEVAAAVQAAAVEVELHAVARAAAHWTATRGFPADFEPAFPGWRPSPWARLGAAVGGFATRLLASVTRGRDRSANG